MTADVTESEPNDFENPNPITLGQSVGGNIATGSGETSDFDVYSMELTAGTVVEYEIASTGPGADGTLIAFLADANFEIIERYLDASTGISKRQVYIPVDGTYVLGVYDQRADLEDAPQHGGDDATYVITTTEVTPTAESLTVGATVAADQNDALLDVYEFTADFDGALVLETTADREPISGELDTVLWITDASTGEIVAFNDDVGGGSYDSRAVLSTVTGTTYRVYVDFWFATTNGSYTLDTFETDDDISAPTELVVGTPGTGVIDAVDGDDFDTDYFFVTLNPGDTVRIQTTGAGGLQPVTTAVVNTFLGLIPFATGYPVAGSSAITIAHPADSTEAGDYYVFVDDLRNVEDPENPADVGEAGFTYSIEASATTRSATAVTLPYTTPGSIGGLGEEVFYEFTIPAGHMFVGNVTTAAADFEPVIAVLENGTAFGQEAPAVLLPSMDTVVQMGVRDAYFRGGAGYDFTPDFSSIDISGITFTPATETEPNDTPGTAQALTAPAAVAGVLDGAGAADLKPDWFKVSATAGQVVGVQTLAGSDANTDDADTVVKIYAPDGTTLLSENDDYDGQESTFFSATAVNADAAGDYYVVVEPYCPGDTDCSGNGDYTLNVFVQ